MRAIATRFAAASSPTSGRGGGGGGGRRPCRSRHGGGARGAVGERRGGSGRPCRCRPRAPGGARWGLSRSAGRRGSSRSCSTRCGPRAPSIRARIASSRVCEGSCRRSASGRSTGTCTDSRPRGASGSSTSATASLVSTRRLALMREGWQQDYQGTPPIFTTGTVGEMVRMEELPDGRFNIVLRGLREFVVQRELQRRPYREAVVVWHAPLAGALPSGLRKAITALVRLYIERLGQEAGDEGPLGA